MIQLPTLSVVIPCYNGRQFVADAIQSVLDQADNGVECIMVDDGSKDGSADYVEQVFGQRIRVIRQANSGAAAARNRGFSESTSELIIWLDADDMLATDTLNSRRKFFFEDPSLEMLIGQSRIVNSTTSEEHIEPRPPCGPDYLVSGLLSRRNLPSQLSVTYRRSGALRAGLYDCAQVIAEDFIFWVKAVSQLHWKFVEEVYGIVRYGNFPSLSNSRGKFYFYDQVGLALRRLRPFLREQTGSDIAWNIAYKQYCRDYALICLNRNFRRGATYWSLKALFQTPKRIDPELCKFLIEAILPASVYDLLARLAKRRQLVPDQMPVA